MAERPVILTLEQINAQFPPQWEVFDGDSGKNKKPIEAQVSRDQSGVIVYVIPGSTREAINRWFPGISEQHIR